MLIALEAYRLTPGTVVKQLCVTTPDNSLPGDLSCVNGVKPAFQGQGYAAVVIEGFRRLSAADGHSQAVVLSTEDPNNLRFYKKMGLHIVAGAKVGELHTWCLALPLPGPE